MEKKPVSRDHGEQPRNLSERKERTLDILRKSIEQIPEIISARVYGSWLHEEDSIDLDVAAVVASEDGVVPAGSYGRLRTLRNSLLKDIGNDVDLISHTEDEVEDIRSPFYNPCYNPSLVEGRDIKSSLAIRPSYALKDVLNFGDLAASVLYDNRTVCRRQLVRTLSEEEARVFIGKLSHGPGNALTLYACKHHIGYIESPSDWFGALYQCDELYGLESDPALDFLRECRSGVDEKTAAALMNWHEHLLAATVRRGDAVKRYNDFCKTLAYD